MSDTQEQQPEKSAQEDDFVIITGMAGAGKTKAVQYLEDLGYFCVDNIPPSLIPKFAELCLQSEGRIRRAALVVDIRGRSFFHHAIAALDELTKMGIKYRILFLEASTDILVRRFKETRRRHPLAVTGNIPEGIRKERVLLQEMRGMANKVIDTSGLSNQQFKEELTNSFISHYGQNSFLITVESFGFKFGLPVDADIVFDVRFLPNPFYEADLTARSGEDPQVQDYVFSTEVADTFIQRFLLLIESLIVPYTKEGKTHLSIAIGCTGGRHRSVAVAIKLAEHLHSNKHLVQLQHRDMEKASPGE